MFPQLLSRDKSLLSKLIVFSFLSSSTYQYNERYLCHQYCNDNYNAHTVIICSSLPLANVVFVRIQLEFKLTKRILRVMFSKLYYVNTMRAECDIDRNSITFLIKKWSFVTDI